MTSDYIILRQLLFLGDLSLILVRAFAYLLLEIRYQNREKAAYLTRYATNLI